MKIYSTRTIDPGQTPIGAPEPIDVPAKPYKVDPNDPFGILPKSIHHGPYWQDNPEHPLGSTVPLEENPEFRRQQQRELEETNRAILQTRVLRMRRLHGEHAPRSRVAAQTLRRPLNRGRARRRVRRAASARAPTGDDDGGGGDPPGRAPIDGAVTSEVPT